MTEPIKWDIIPPEIKNDNFYNLIIKVIQIDKSIKNILEIGASSGDGSTEAFMTGKQDRDIQLYSVEVCTERFEILKGQILAGNDSKELVKEFKVAMLKFVKEGRIPKREANEILYELMALGF
jgi:hypothetical protein